MSTLHVFCSTIPSVNYLFPNGKPAIFVNNKFYTSVQEEIDHLQNEIKLGHPMIFQKTGEETMDAKYLDPMVGLREKIIAEAIAAGIVSAGDPNRNMGTTTQAPLKPATTVDISQAMAGGSGASLTNLASMLGVNKASGVK